MAESEQHDGLRLETEIWMDVGGYVLKELVDVEAAKCPVLAALSRAGMARDTVSLCTQLSMSKLCTPLACIHEVLTDVCTYI